MNNKASYLKSLSAAYTPKSKSNLVIVNALGRTVKVIK